MLHVYVHHRHEAALVVLIEVAETQVDAVIESGLQIGVTDYDVQRIALVGNRLQLSYAWLAAAQAVVKCQVACLGELVANAGKRCHAPSPSRRNVAGTVDEVSALRHRRVNRESHIEVHSFGNLLVANLDILVKELVAEVIAEFLVEDAAKFIAKFHVDDFAQQFAVLKGVGSIGVLNHRTSGGVEHQIHHDVVTGDLWHRHYLVAISCDVIHTLVGLGHIVACTIG